VVAVLLAAVAGLIAADLISKFLGHPVHVVPAALARDGRIWHWGDPRALVASGVICALGLLLISIAALPGRFRVVPVASEDPLSVTGFTRPGLRRYLAAAATTVDGVASARVRVRRRYVRVLAVSPLRDSEGPGALVETAVHYPPLACPHMAAKPRTPQIAGDSCVTIRRPACLTCVKAQAQGTLPR
jgi:hypothetical protein